ncbi:hypothetical protein C8J55DRAFT_11995 [Lentinula edodes]|uniref:DUF6534 domain-containing protein n=1 Tax=Lentinula lateritia TaxID=40482 RepID=A0A9W9B1P9_9AGAR|nr:hypothetical protein C8J55DRAFT_11995 [Lentinula edodes]
MQFLGYILSYFLSGILLVQLFLYYLSFHRTDPRQIIITVFAVFFVEFLSTVFATMIVIMALIVDGFISYSIFLWGFKIVALLSGLAAFMVHAFYCWRIRILGGHWGIIVVVIIISTYQCVMVSISGFGVLENGTGILGAGTQTITDPKLLFINVSWLAGTSICDIIIATTILHLQHMIIKKHCTTDQLMGRVERVMSIAIDSGMITAIGAAMELLFFLVWRNSLIHFILFFTLPKLYANCLMATLNARLAVPGRGFRESAMYRARESLAIDDAFFDKLPTHSQEAYTNFVSGIDAKIQAANNGGPTLDIKRRSMSTLASSLNSETYCVHLEAPTRRNSILDLRTTHVNQDHGNPLLEPARDHAQTTAEFSEIAPASTLLLPTTVTENNSPGRISTDPPNNTSRRHTIMNFHSTTPAVSGRDIHVQGELEAPGTRLVHSKSDPNLSATNNDHAPSKPADKQNFSIVSDESHMKSIDSAESEETKFLLKRISIEPFYGPFPSRLEPLRRPEAALQFEV